MGKLIFGTDETIDCVSSITLKGQDNETLCLAHKTTIQFFGAGVFLKDDGYVLGVPGKKGVYYPWPEAQQVKAWQSEHRLPDPLPAYSISPLQYVVGYSLWLVIALVIAWTWAQKVVTRRRQARDALVPISLGPPQVVTEGDRFITSAVTAMLQPQERLLHQAHAVTTNQYDPNAYFLALTSARLIIISSKRSLFKVVHEAQKVDVVDRAAITRVTEESREVTFELNTGAAVAFVVPPSEKAYSNQVAFVRDVPRMFATERLAAAVVQVT